MLAEGHRGQIAPGRGGVRSGGPGWPARPVGRGPEDAARGPRDARTGLLGRGRLPSLSHPSSARCAALTVRAAWSQPRGADAPGQTSLTTQHYSYT